MVCCIITGPRDIQKFASLFLRRTSECPTEKVTLNPTRVKHKVVPKPGVEPRTNVLSIKHSAPSTTPSLVSTKPNVLFTKHSGRSIKHSVLTTKSSVLSNKPSGSWAWT